MRHADPATPLVGDRALQAAVGLVALAVLAGLVLLWPHGRELAPRRPDPTRVVSATLVKVTTVPCGQQAGAGASQGQGGAEPGLPGSTCVEVEARRSDSGQVARFRTTDPTGDTFRAGLEVELAVAEQPGQEPVYSIRDIERGRPLALLAAVFVGAVLAFGGWQGARSLLGLAVTLLVVVGFAIPAILDGRSPAAVAIVSAGAIMLVVLYLTHGPSRKTTAALLGTIMGLALTVALSSAFIAAAALTGLASEDAVGVSFEAGGLSLRGLLLAGIILGSLGVLDDVTMSQASLVAELHRANPAAGPGKLVRGALTVGRDHVGATVNTLFLAYAGASLPLLVLFVVGGEPLAEVATAEVVAVEVVRTLCGSLGLIAAVPLTTVLAALLLRRPGGPGAEAAAPAGRAPYGLPQQAGDRERRALWGAALRLFGGGPPATATVEVGAGSWLAHLEAAPPEVRQAAAELERLARAGAPRRGRAGAALAHLDLRDRRHLELLWHYGLLAASVAVRLDGEPDPVVTVTPEPGSGQPRVTAWLLPEEVSRVRAFLAEAGASPSALTPGRGRESRRGQRGSQGKPRP